MTTPDAIQIRFNRAHCSPQIITALDRMGPAEVRKLARIAVRHNHTGNELRSAGPSPSEAQRRAWAKALDEFNHAKFAEGRDEIEARRRIINAIYGFTDSDYATRSNDIVKAVVLAFCGSAK